MADSWKIVAEVSKDVARAALVAHEDAIDWPPEWIVTGMEVADDRPEEWMVSFPCQYMFYSTILCVI